MIKLDHIAINTNDLDKTLEFYQKIGYDLIKVFNDSNYRWATLLLNKTSLEIFETKEVAPHVAYSFSSDKEAAKLIKSLNYKMDNMEIFYGNLNRKSFFIEDNNGNQIQFIKK